MVRLAPRAEVDTGGVRGLISSGEPLELSARYDFECAVVVGEVGCEVEVEDWKERIEYHPLLGC